MWVTRHARTGKKRIPRESNQRVRPNFKRSPHALYRLRMVPQTRSTRFAGEGHLSCAKATIDLRV